MDVCGLPQEEQRRIKAELQQLKKKLKKAQEKIDEVKTKRDLHVKGYADYLKENNKEHSAAEFSSYMDANTAKNKSTYKTLKIHELSEAEANLIKDPYRELFYNISERIRIETKGAVTVPKRLIKKIAQGLIDDVDDPDINAIKELMESMDRDPLEAISIDTNKLDNFIKKNKIELSEEDHKLLLSTRATAISKDLSPAELSKMITENPHLADNLPTWNLLNIQNDKIDMTDFITSPVDTINLIIEKTAQARVAEEKFGTSDIHGAFLAIANEVQVKHPEVDLSKVVDNNAILEFLMPKPKKDPNVEGIVKWGGIVSNVTVTLVLGAASVAAIGDIVKVLGIAARHGRFMDTLKAIPKSYDNFKKNNSPEFISVDYATSASKMILNENFEGSKATKIMANTLLSVTGLGKWTNYAKGVAAGAHDSAATRAILQKDREYLSKYFPEDIIDDFFAKPKDEWTRKTLRDYGAGLLQQVNREVITGSPSTQSFLGTTRQGAMGTINGLLLPFVGFVFENFGREIEAFHQQKGTTAKVKQSVEVIAVGAAIGLVATSLKELSNGEQPMITRLDELNEQQLIDYLLKVIGENPVLSLPITIGTLGRNGSASGQKIEKLQKIFLNDKYTFREKLAEIGAQSVPNVPDRKHKRDLQNMIRGWGSHKLQRKAEQYQKAFAKKRGAKPIE